MTAGATYIAVMPRDSTTITAQLQTRHTAALAILSEGILAQLVGYTDSEELTQASAEEKARHFPALKLVVVRVVEGNQQNWRRN
jgi:hypothetical protein